MESLHHRSFEDGALNLVPWCDCEAVDTSSSAQRKRSRAAPQAPDASSEGALHPSGIAGQRTPAAAVQPLAPAASVHWHFARPASQGRFASSTELEALDTCSRGQLLTACTPLCGSATINNTPERVSSIGSEHPELHPRQRGARRTPAAMRTQWYCVDACGGAVADNHSPSTRRLTRIFATKLTASAGCKRRGLAD
jgi:hypothetical protein